MKVVTKNYYQTIREISYSPAYCIKNVFPIHKFGEKIKFLGIPLSTYEENLYDWSDFAGYCHTFDPGDLVGIDDISPKKGYSIETFDKFVSICKMAYIDIDGEITYFANNEMYEKYLSVIKGRCSEIGNPIYKTIILDKDIIY